MFNFKPRGVYCSTYKKNRDETQQTSLPFRVQISKFLFLIDLMKTSNTNHSTSIFVRMNLAFVPVGFRIGWFSYARNFASKDRKKPVKALRTLVKWPGRAVGKIAERVEYDRWGSSIGENRGVLSRRERVVARVCHVSKIDSNRGMETRQLVPRANYNSACVTGRGVLIVGANFSKKPGVAGVHGKW